MSPPRLESSTRDPNKNTFAFDHRSEQNNYREHIAGFDYGLTDWWLVTIEGTAEKQPHDKYSYVASKLENIFVLTNAVQLPGTRATLKGLLEGEASGRGERS